MPPSVVTPHPVNICTHHRKHHQYSIMSAHPLWSKRMYFYMDMHNTPYTQRSSLTVFTLTSNSIPTLCTTLGKCLRRKLSQRMYKGMFQNKTHASDQTYYNTEKISDSLNVWKGPQVKGVRGHCRECLPLVKVLGWRAPANG